MTLKVAVIICTKNRSNDLDISLNSIFLQTLLPDAVLIIDDSNNDVTEKITKKYSSISPINIIYLRPKPITSGLPAARNFGITHVPRDTEIIVFLDDDVTLDPHFLKKIIQQFLSSQKVVGVGGVISEGYHNRPWYEKPILAMIGFLLPSLVPVSLFHYRITKSGVALRPLFIKSNETFRNAEWLSGCNMAYRKSVFRNGIFFDESLVRYAFGEDVLFSHTLYKNGEKILITNEARLQHRLSSGDRLPSKIHLTMIFGYRKYLIQKFSGTGRKNSLYYMLFILNFFISAFVLSIIRKNNFSYMKNTIEAYNNFKLFEKKIEDGDLESFNTLFLEPNISSCSDTSLNE